MHYAEGKHFLVWLHLSRVCASRWSRLNFVKLNVRSSCFALAVTQNVGLGTSQQGGHVSMSKLIKNALCHQAARTFIYKPLPLSLQLPLELWKSTESTECSRADSSPNDDKCTLSITPATHHFHCRWYLLSLLQSFPRYLQLSATIRPGFHLKVLSSCQLCLLFSSSWQLMSIRMCEASFVCSLLVMTHFLPN